MLKKAIALGVIMAVPKYDEMMYPILDYLAKNPDNALSNIEIGDYVCEYFALNDFDKGMKTSSGQTLFMNRVQWACSYLKNAGLVISPKRATFSGRVCCSILPHSA